MNRVLEVLDFLGYDEIRLRNGRWKPISEVNGSLGTTDETHVIQEDEPPRIRLRNPETGEEIGRARKAPPSGADQSAREEEGGG